MPAPGTLARLSGLIVVLCYVGGWAYLLAMPFLAQDFYVDENAFVAYSLHASVPGDADEKLLATGLRAREHQGSMFEWMYDELARSNVEVHAFNSTENRKHRFVEVPDIVYCILRARRSNGEDSMVLVVPYDRNREGSGDGETSGVDMAVVLMRHLSGVKWLSKDVILLAVPRSSSGDSYHAPKAVEEWLDAYHSLYINPIDFGTEAFRRAGNIRAALIVDVPSCTKIMSLSLVAGGKLSQLPNFDIVSIVQHVLRRNSISLTISDHYDGWLNPRIDMSWPWHHFRHHKTMFRSMADSVSEQHTGLHGPFLAYNIDAISLSAVDAVPDETHLGGSSFVSLLRASEEWVRGISNLIEKLHHSLYLYVISSPETVIALGTSFPAVIIFAVPLGFKALSVAYNLSIDSMLPSSLFVLMVYLCMGIARILPSVVLSGVIASSITAPLLLVLLPIAVCVFMSKSMLPSVRLDWIQALALCPTIAIGGAFGILNFGLTLMVLFFIIPLLLITSTSPRLLNFLVIIACSPASVLAAGSFIFNMPMSTLFEKTLRNIVSSNNLAYSAFFVLYLPLYFLHSLVAIAPRHSPPVLDESKKTQ